MQGSQNQVTVTFYGTEFFKNIQGYEVTYGTSIDTGFNSKILTDKDDENFAEKASKMSQVLSVILILAIGLLLIILRQSLLSIWMAFMTI